MFKNIFFISIFFVSCTHLKENSNQQIFKAPKDQVWEVIIDVLKKSYPSLKDPFQEINEQKGYIKTKTFTSNHFWKAPYQKDRDFSGYSSELIIKMDYKKPYARVFIYKKIYQQKGFISSKKEIPSDLIEEEILLYRIDRELKIRAFLDKL